MFKYVILWLAACSSIGASKLYKLQDYEAYYWRDFKGTVPNDAFPAGKYNNDVNIYIVQVLHDNLLIPGRLDQDLKHAIYEYSTRKWSTTKNVKIFCTTFPFVFEWYSTNTSSFVVDKSFIPGGYEPKYSIFIGRGVASGDQLIGKVVFGVGFPVLLHTIQGSESIRLNHFDVLSFTPVYVNKVPKIDLSDDVFLTSAYHWRDFKGVVPHDAFSAGQDSNGESIYIVQVFHKGNLIPGVLYLDGKLGIFEYENQELYSKEYIKIFCTESPEKFKWKKPQDWLSINNKIYGGYEKDKVLFIGRGVYDSELLVGKVIVDDNDVPTFYSTLNGDLILLQSYEVLVYDGPKEIYSSTTSSEEYTPDLPVNSKLPVPIPTEAELPPLEYLTSVSSTETSKGLDLNSFIMQYLKNSIEITKQNNNTKSREDVRSVVNSDSNENCKCGQRIYIININ